MCVFFSFVLSTGRFHLFLPVLLRGVAITQIGLILAQVITDGAGQDKAQQDAEKDDVD